MKFFLLAAAVATGLLFSANSADAQYRSHHSNIYVAPSFNSAPVYRYPAYTYPAFGPVYSVAPTPGFYSNNFFTPYSYGSSYGSFYSGYNGFYGSNYSGAFGGYRYGRWGW